MKEDKKIKYESPIRYDTECIHCKRFTNCVGKPLGTERCVCFEERKDKK